MSVLIGVALFVLAVLVLPTGQALVVDDARGWLPHLARALVRSAARRLPLLHQARYEEDWLAELSDWADRPLSAIVQAWSIRRGARSFCFTLCGARRPTMLDRLGAAVGLMFVAPLLAVIALAIRATSPGPVVFRTRSVDARSVAPTR